MRIAYLTGSFPARSETFVVRQISAIAGRGHAVDVFTLHPPDSGAETPDSGVNCNVKPLYRARGQCGKLSRAVQSAISLLKRDANVFGRIAAHGTGHGVHGLPRLLASADALVRAGRPRYDVIHAQFGPYGVLATDLVGVGALHGPVVTSFRGYDATKDLEKCRRDYRRLFERGALFLPVSQSLAERLVAAGCPRDRIRVHRSGLALGSLPFTPPAGKQQNPIRLISVGRLVEKKGLRYALEAIAKLRRSKRELRYQVVGDGPLRAALEDQAHGLGIGDCVEFTGWRPHEAVVESMTKADLLVVPSVTAADGDEEGIPNVAKEAMALGVLVVATRHGGIPELIEDGVSGVLVPERDSEALAARIGALIDHRQNWSEMARAARSRIETDYDIERLGDELVSLYETVAGSGKSGRGSPRPAPAAHRTAN